MESSQPTDPEVERFVDSADFDPIVVDSQLTAQRIGELLGRRRESAKLDYKLHFDPSVTRDRVELTKDLVAMANSAGGYVVLGVDDRGHHHGLTAEQIKRIDEATIRGQVEGYLGTGLVLFVDRDVIWDEKHFAIITVLRSMRAPLVFRAPGQYSTPNEKKGVTAFRQGDVFVRHGSASERWNQNDVQTLFARVVERERERWLAEVLPSVRQLLAMALPSVQTQPSLPDARSLILSDAESFERALRDLARRLP